MNFKIKACATALAVLMGVAVSATFSSGAAAATSAYCTSDSADPDGDGWGWENNASCVVKPGTGSYQASSVSDTTSASQALTGVIKVVGNKIIDTKGQQLVLRGVNLQYGDNPSSALASIKEIAATGANSVRLELTDSTTASQLEAALDAIVANNMVAMPMYWGAETTCYGTTAGFDKAMSLWKNTWMPVIIKAKYQPYLMVNPLNEWGGKGGSLSDYRTKYVQAIKDFRAAGLKAPLVIDAPECGQAAAFIAQSAWDFKGADNLRNTILSIHAYWSYTTASAIQTAMTKMDSTGMPWLWGEVPYNQFQKSDSANTDHVSLWALAKTNSIGWLAWSWYGNGSCCTVLDMSTGYGTSLTAWGKEVVSGTNGIKATSKALGAGGTASTTSSTGSVQTSSAKASSTSSTTTTSGYPVCASKASDPDGDGWGWENNASCQVTAATSNGGTTTASSSTSSKSSSTTTTGSVVSCVSKVSDPDGDGWGWENGASCQITSASTDAEGPTPYCKTDSADPDGDGWGWENNASCVVKPGTGSYQASSVSDTTSASQALTGVIKVVGNKIIDTKGQQLVLRGVNLQYGDNPSSALASIKEIAATGANSVRLELTDSTTASQLEAALDAIVANNMVAMPMYWGAETTCYGTTAGFDKAMSLWKNTWMPVIIKAKYQPYLMVNPLNEWGGKGGSLSDYRSKYVQAIKDFRAAGLKAPIVIDAPECGQAAAFIAQSAWDFKGADNLRNTILSIHAYWSYTTASAIQTAMTKMDSTGMAWLWGEVPYNQFQKSDAANTDHVSLWALAKTNNIGWLAWSWYGNGSCCTVLDMSTGYGTSLTAWGTEVVSGTNGIKATSKPLGAGGTVTTSSSSSVASSETSSEASSESSTGGTTTYPSCATKASDPDGDGWGWENGATCQVTGSTAEGTTPVCASADSDPDGDGWGWENGASCIANGGGSASSSVPSDTSSSTSSSVANSSTPTTSTGTDGVVVAYTLNGNWGTGYCANVTVTNNGSAAANWTVSVKVGGTVNQMWNAENWAQSGDSLSFSAPSWAGALAPGASFVGTGFCANGSPTDFTGGVSVSSSSQSVSSSSSSSKSSSSKSSSSSSSKPTSSSSSSSISSSATSTSGSNPVPGWTGPVNVCEAGALIFDTTVDCGGKSIGLKCDGGSETQPAVLTLINATVKNVRLAKGGGSDGIHCGWGSLGSGLGTNVQGGTCNLENVVWEEVCEDAASIGNGQKTTVMNIKGGSATNASDKVFQNNGIGSTLNVTGFATYGSVGKLSRSCGDCTGNGGPRYFNINGVTMEKVSSSVVGVNTNFGDKATIRNLKIKGYKSGKPKVCVEYTGVKDHQGSSKALGEAWGSTACDVKTSDVTSY